VTADDTNLLLTAEVADILRVPVGTLRYWRSVGRGPASFKLGATVVYRRSAIDAFIDAQEAATVRGAVAS
jgi:hypothetical protein